MVAIGEKRVKIVKKRNHRFTRHESDRYHRVRTSWRKPKGIDNRVRRRFKGQRVMPSIGFRNAKATRDVLPNGFKKVTVHNAKVSILFLYDSLGFIQWLCYSFGVIQTCFNSRCFRSWTCCSCRTSTTAARLPTP